MDPGLSRDDVLDLNNKASESRDDEGDTGNMAFCLLSWEENFQAKAAVVGCSLVFLWEICVDICN